MIYLHNNIKKDIKLYTELHGQRNFSLSDIRKNTTQTTPPSTKNQKRKYGIILGRFQPFHNGHNSIVQDIILDNLEPIIIIGSTNIKNNKNPLSFKERKELIKEIYPKVIIIPSKDYNSWDEWFDNLIKELYNVGIEPNECVLYAHNKKEDYSNFSYNNKHYINEHYTKIFKENNIQIKFLEEYKCNLGLVTHASDIRKDIEVAKRNLDTRIFNILKEKRFWDKE